MTFWGLIFMSSATSVIIKKIEQSQSGILLRYILNCTYTLEIDVYSPLLSFPFVIQTRRMDSDFLYSPLLYFPLEFFPFLSTSFLSFLVLQSKRCLSSKFILSLSYCYCRIFTLLMFQNNNHNFKFKTCFSILPFEKVTF